jgi:hypothetical protein
LTKIKTGMSQEATIDSFFGGDYSQWSYGHCWFMYYLDNRYACIIGHEGILHFLPLFGEFCDAIEHYCQKDQLYGSQALKSCHSTSAALLMALTIRLRCHILVRLEIMKVLLENCNTLLLRSPCTLSTKSSIVGRWRLSSFLTE